MDRRRFLTLAAAAAAAGAARGAGRRAPGDGELRLGLAAGGWTAGLSLDALLDRLAAARFGALALAEGAAPEVRLDSGPEQRAVLRRRIEESGVALAQLACAARPGAGDEAAARRGGALSRRWLELAADLGAPALELRPAEAQGPPGVARVADALAALGARAEELGLELRVSNRGGLAPEHLRALLAGADHPRVRAGLSLAGADLGGHAPERVVLALRAWLGGAVTVPALAEDAAGGAALFERLAAEGFAGDVLLAPPGAAPPDLGGALAAERAAFERLCGA